MSQPIQWSSHSQADVAEPDSGHRPQDPDHDTPWKIAHSPKFDNGLQTTEGRGSHVPVTPDMMALFADPLDFHEIVEAFHSQST